ncbi:DMT family transporter [Microcoleus sp. N3A4]|uniref:DMT family transporter n=1 Tax=Microcoleus sp. N3A4 TaxID=3055379 RepID=UPI002FD0B9E3
MATSSPDSASSFSARWLRGLSLVLLATVAVSLQNVITRIALSPKAIPILGGIINLGGYIDPTADKMQVTLLELLLRISFVVPLSWLIMPVFKPGAWGEARSVIVGSDRMLKLQIVAAGIFLFLSQIGIYLSIANIGPAMAITIFFTYPTVTTLLAWKLFSDRPSLQQWLAIILIYIGCAWLAFKPIDQNLFCPPICVKHPPSAAALPPAPNQTPTPNASNAPTIPKPATQPNPIIGYLAAIISSIVFALEGIIAQACFSKVNPATFTALVFTVEWLVLMAVTLPFIHVDINQELILMGGLLCLTTFATYLFSNFGIKAIGAASTAIIVSSRPAVTSILALLIIGDTLLPEQWGSIIVVTAGVVLMNVAKAMKKPT